MKITITNDNLLGLSKTLNELILADKGGIKFKYAVIRNVKFIEDAVSTLNDMKKPSDAFTAYQKSIYDLAVKHCEVDDNGNLKLYTDDTFSQLIDNVKVTNGIPKVKEGDEEGYKEALEKLEKDNKKVIVAHNKKLNKFNELLNVEIEVEVYAITIDMLEGLDDIDYLHLLHLNSLITDDK